MKFLSGLTAVVSILSVSIAAPMSSPVDNVLEKRIEKCEGWAELIRIDTKAAGGGYDRWFWKYGGFSCKKFRDRLNSKGVLTGPLSSRTDCDNPEVEGEYHVTTWKGAPSNKNVISAVKSITGEPCKDLNLPDWGYDRCMEMMDDQYMNDGCLT